MGTPTNYLIAASVCLAFAYLIYLLFFRKETNFRQRRFFLIFAAVFSLLLPTGSYYILLPLTTKTEIQKEILAPSPVLESPNPRAAAPDFYPVNPVSLPDTEPVKKSRSIDWLQALQYLYIAGVIVLLLRFIVQLVTINIWYYRSRKVKQPLFTLLFHERFSTPFSFFNWIFLTEKRLPETDFEKIIAHESVHVKQRHSFDAVFFELLCIFMWFNPFVWMMRRSINLTHEFLADEGAIQSGIDSLHYQALMVNQVAEANIVSVTSHFNKSLLSQRIKMIANSRLYKKAKYKILVLAPVALVLFLFIAGVNGLDKRKVLYRNLKKDAVISKVFSKDEIKDLVELRLMTDEMVVNVTGEPDTKIAYQKFNESLSSRSTMKEVMEAITIPHDSLVVLVKSSPAFLQIYDVSNVNYMNFSLNREGKVMEFLRELSKLDSIYSDVLNEIEIAGDISPSTISSFIKEPYKYNMESEAEQLYACIIYGILSNKITYRNETKYDSKAVELNNSGAAMILNDPEGALGLFNKALEIQPDLPSALLNSAKIYIKLYEFDKAKQRLRKLTEIRSEEPEYWRVLGLVYDLEGDTQNAMKMYEKSFQIYEKMLGTDNRDKLYIAKINLASLYILMGNVEKGRELCDVLKEEYPDRSELIEGMETNLTRETIFANLQNPKLNNLFHRDTEIIIQHPEEYSKNFLKGIYNRPPEYRRIELKGNQLILNDIDIYSLPDYIDLDKQYQMEGKNDNVQVSLSFTRNTYSSIRYLVNVKQKGKPEKQYTGEAEMLSTFFFGKEWVKDDRKNETFAAEQFLNDKDGEWINIKIGEDGPGKLRVVIETGDFKCPTLRTKTTTSQVKDSRQGVESENSNGGSGNAGEIIILTELPKLNSYLADSIRQASNNFSLLVSSSQISPSAKIKVDGIVFEVAWDLDNRVSYIMTTDTNFSTAEGIRINTTLIELKKLQEVKIFKMPGWAYYAVLNSGWGVAFSVDKTMTGRELLDSDRIQWIFKRPGFRTETTSSTEKGSWHNIEKENSSSVLGNAKLQEECGCFNGIGSSEADKPSLVAEFSNGVSVSVCGYERERISDTEVVISEFNIFDCKTGKSLLEYSAVHTCNVKLAEGKLYITELEDLPAGENWKWESIPMMQEYLFVNGDNLSKSPRKFVYQEINIPKTMVDRFLQEVRNLKGKGYNKDFETILGRLALLALNGNIEAKNILSNFETYFNSSPDGSVAELLNRWTSLIYREKDNQSQRNTVAEASVNETNLQKDYQLVVSDFIKVIKSNNVEKIADNVAYPLKREYPVPSIKNKQEFINHYKEVFDDNLKHEIINSNPATDWSAVGWRGIMLKQGIVWLDYNGRLIGLNYQPKEEKLLKEQLIETDKETIYPSLSKFEKPICVFETSEYRIRIDDLGDGNYRYASWSINKSMKDKPDQVIENGEITFEGSGGNHTYKFENAGYRYECSVMLLRKENSTPAIFKIFEGNQELKSQNAKIVEGRFSGEVMKYSSKLLSSENDLGDLRNMDVQTLFARLRFKPTLDFMPDPDEEKFIVYGETYGNDLISGIRLDVRNWLSHDDLKFLMSNLESQEPCKSMMSIFSSWRPDVESTIGGFAALFLDYYRKNQLFHPLVATPTTTPEMIEELKEWWDNYKNETNRK